MFDHDQLNIWEVLVAWLVNMAVGAFWYSPAGFSKQWQKHTGIDIMKIPTQQANKILAAVAVSSLVQAFALGFVVFWAGPTSALEAVYTALTLWVGFVAATTVGTTLYQKRSWAFLWLNASYFLVVMVINTLVLYYW